MKVLHVNAGDGRGGAAIAVVRLQRALREKGIDSRVLVQEKQSRDDHVEPLPLPVAGAADRLRFEAIEHAYRDRNRTHLSSTHFSLSLIGEDLSHHPAVEAADLVHLHWIASLQTPASLERLLRLGKPVVWTLHDVGPFTGGCHFPAGCRRFEDTCDPCAQLRSDPFHLPAATLRDKKRWPLENLTLVAPSRWIADQAERSSLFRSAPRVTVIPNGVDPAVFRPIPQAEARAALGIPPAGTYVLCGADQGLDMRKGFGVLRQVLDECARDRRFISAEGRLLHVGTRPAMWEGADWPLTSLGHVSDEARMALAFAAADLFALPSLEDNQPNMMLEALSSGRPVIAFRVGGIPEVVRDGWNGRVVAEGDVASMVQGILETVADPARRGAMGQNARASIEADYSTAIQAERHIALYETLLANRKPANAALGYPALAATDPGPAVAALLPELTIHCLQEEWQIAESDRTARGQVIEMMQGQLRRLESECAARLRVIEELDQHCKRQAAELAARLPKGSSTHEP